MQKQNSIQTTGKMPNMSRNAEEDDNGNISPGF